MWRQDPFILISTAVSSIVSALTPYVGIYLTAQIIREIAGRRDPNRLIQWIVIALVSAAFLSALTAGLTRWKNSYRQGDWYKRKKIFVDKLLSMDFCDADNPKTYDSLSQIQQNDMWGRWGLALLVYAFETLIASITTILGGVMLTVTLFTAQVPSTCPDMLFLNHWSALVCVFFLMLATSWIAPILASKAESYYAKVGDDAKLSNRLFYFFGYIGYDRIKALDMRLYRQDRICKKYNERINQRFGSASTLAVYARGPMGALYALSAAIPHVFTALIWIFVGLKAWAGAFGVGLVTQYIGAALALSSGISGLLSFFGSMRNNETFLEQAMTFLDVPHSMHQGSLSVDCSMGTAHEIVFQNVSFQYGVSELYAIKNLSMTFKTGHRLAIVGENGSGKTTFIKLLCRMYDPIEGVILLDGKDIRDYDYARYIAMVSVVFQDFRLLAYTLGQNVSASATYDEVKATQCLEKVGFGKRLRSLEKGLETYLYKGYDESGVEISGGEAQKIALARALYKDSPILILDEPTAALDPMAEFELYSKMDEIAAGRTVVYISHRLSSCRFCDDILVFHEGEMIQRGDHDTLVADQQGKYSQLWNAQAQYYQ
ncbi:MAG: ABC transporter ATP-binding protein/permease [Clostridium sp.]|nr:ABC transporter ATP-binding protein/permease [Clostridium sp.]